MEISIIGGEGVGEGRSIKKGVDFKGNFHKMIFNIFEFQNINQLYQILKGKCCSARPMTKSNGQSHTHHIT